MATFGTTTFSDGSDEWIQLGNEEWVRQLSMSNNWTHIRIGVLWAVVGSATIPATNGFAIGMCSGTTHPFNDPACTNFVGICNDGGGLTFVSSAPNNYWQLTGTMGNAATKIGSTLNLSASNIPDSVSMCLPAVGATNRRGLVYVDIVKGSPNYSITWSQVVEGGGGGSHVDFTVSNLKTGLALPLGSIVVAGQTFNAGNGTQTMACSEAAGIFDTVDVYSNFPSVSNGMQVYEVAAQKIA